MLILNEIILAGFFYCWAEVNAHDVEKLNGLQKFVICERKRCFRFSAAGVQFQILLAFCPMNSADSLNVDRTLQ